MGAGPAPRPSGELGLSLAARITTIFLLLTAHALLPRLLSRAHASLRPTADAPLRSSLPWRASAACPPPPPASLAAHIAYASAAAPQPGADCNSAAGLLVAWPSSRGLPPPQSPPPAAPPQLLLAASEDLCYIVAVRQPRAVSAYVAPNPPILMVRAAPPELVRWNVSGHYPRAHPALPRGAPPDALLVRIVEGSGVERPLQAPALVGGADGAAGADGCAWTAYAGGAPALLLSRLHGGAASLRVEVDHAAFTWAANPRYDHYGLLGPAASVPGDAFGEAYLPYFAPLALPPIGFSLPPQGPPAVVAAPLPLCGGMEEPGAWAPGPAVPSSLGPGASGLFWAARGCAFRRLTTLEATRCLARAAPRIHMYGDSNMRRAYKSLVGMTSLPREVAASAPAHDASTESAWCAGKRGAQKCACEDKDETWPFTVPHVVQADVPGEAAMAAHLRYDEFFSFAYTDWALKADYFSNSSGYFWGGDGGGYGLDTGRYNAPIEAGRPTHVVFNAGQWEVAFSSFPRFAASIELLAADLLDHYPATTLFIYRTLNFLSGVDPNHLYASTGGKAAAVHEHALRVLRERLGGRLRVWDVWALGEARPLAETRAQIAGCHSNHEHSEDIDVSIQVLLNGLCNKINK